jgi:hypothetical protein
VAPSLFRGFFWNAGLGPGSQAPPKHAVCDSQTGVPHSVRPMQSLPGERNRTNGCEQCTVQQRTGRCESQSLTAAFMGNTGNTATSDGERLNVYNSPASARHASTRLLTSHAREWVSCMGINYAGALRGLFLSSLLQLLRAMTTSGLGLWPSSVTCVQSAPPALCRRTKLKFATRQLDLLRGIYREHIGNKNSAQKRATVFDVRTGHSTRRLLAEFNQPTFYIFGRNIRNATRWRPLDAASARPFRNIGQFQPHLHQDPDRHEQVRP